MNVIFRKATIENIERLTTLRIKQLQEGEVTQDIDISKNIFDYYSRAMSDDSFLAWVAVIDNAIVATCGVSFQKKPPYYSNTSGLLGEICSVYTEKEYRRRGLAKKLLQYITDEARSRGVFALRVSASKMGESLYKNFGFIKAENFFVLQI